MPANITQTAFPVSATIMVIGSLALSLLILPSSHRVNRTTAAPSTMPVFHRTAEPGPLLDSLTRNPAIVTRPSLIEAAVQSDIKHALPDGHSTRHLRPLPFLELEEKPDLDGQINVTRFIENCNYPGHSSLSQRRQSRVATSSVLSPVSVIAFDEKTLAYNPETPPLPVSCITNYPWSVTVSVHYNALGLVEHALLSAPSKDSTLNWTVLRSARVTRLTRPPGAPISGEIRFRCLVGVEKQDTPGQPQANGTTP